MKQAIMRCKWVVMMFVFALLMANCSQDEEVVQQWQGGVSRLTADIEGQSRSTMTDTGIFSWTKGDSISVWNDMPDEGVDAFVKFVFADGNYFNIDPKAGVSTIKPANYAVYPAGNHTYSEEAVKIHLPSGYGNAEEDYVPDTHAPMIAVVKPGNTHLEFKHVGGVMRFKVQNVPAGANQFVFTASDKDVTGDFKVEKGIITAGDKISKNAVTIRFKTLTKVTESMTFYVPLPVGTYAGYAVSIKGDNDLNLSFDGSGLQNTIARRSLLLMPTLVCDEEKGLTKGVQQVKFEEMQDGTDPVVSIAGNDVEIDTEGAGEDASLDLTYAPGNASAVLNIGDVATETEPEASKATVRLSVPNNAKVSVLNLDVPTLTVELSTAENGTATYDVVTALTALNTLKINKGITVKKLILKGGNVVIGEGAIVESVENLEGFNQKVYTLNKGTFPKKAPENVRFVTTEDEMALYTAAEHGGKVSLKADISLSEPLVIADTAIIDLNGHAIKPSGSTLTKVLETNDALILVRRGGSLTLCDTAEEGGGSVDTGNNQSIFAAIKLTDAKDEGENNAELIVQGGKIKGYYYGIVGNGNRHGTQVTLSGGTIETGYCAEDNIGIYHPQNGTLTISGGSISGYNSAVEMRSGTLKVDGGTLVSTASAASAETNANGSTIKGAAIAVSQHATNQPLSVTVTGGTFTGHYALYEEDKQDENVEGLSLNVNGGTWTGKIFSANCKGFIANGIFTDASAFTYVADKGNLTLGTDISLEEPLVIPNEMVVTLNGKTVTSKKNVFEVAGGKLTIAGEGHVKAGMEGESVAYSAVFARDKAEVIIAGGTFESKHAIDQGDGLQHWVLDTQTPETDAAKSTITVQGGTFINFNPANNVSDGATTNYLTTGYEVQVNGTAVTTMHDATTEADSRTEYVVVKKD